MSTRQSLIVLAVLCFAAAGCSSHREPKTPREFIERYSAAWRDGDVDQILNMQKSGDSLRTDERPAPSSLPNETALQEAKDRIRESIARKDFSYLAWTNTSYVSEQEHEDHVHVNVRVDAAISEVVLVREGTALKIVNDPGRYR